MALQHIPNFVKWLAPLVVSAAVSYGGLRAHEAVETDRNERARADVESLKARIEPNARWQQHVDDKLESFDNALERIEHAVGSK